MEHLKHRAVLVFFVVFAAALAAFFIIYRNAGSHNNFYAQPQIVTPVTGAEQQGELGNGAVSESESEMTSFIPLLPDETLVSISTIDFDNDMSDDQVNLIKKVTSPYLYLLIGLYNPETGSYERTTELETSVTQGHTFSYAFIDVLGNHQLSLVYQGITDGGDAILEIYSLYKDRKKHAVLKNIGSFKSDGSIFVQQQQRDQAYELSQVNGEPFPVIVYGSDPNAQKNSYDQFQTKYEWNAMESKFVQTLRTRISERRIAANELAKIQDGTVKTFTNFLDGLWYKTSNEGGGLRYLFFDYENSEVILQYNDSEEVYAWVESYLSNSGIYLSTENETIANLHRRYYITLIAADEIRLRVQEDLGMTINESNLWDGNYKKMNSKTVIAAKETAVRSSDFAADLTGGEIWYAADGTQFSFSNGNYAISGDLINETGKYALLDIASLSYITFRSDSSTPFVKPSYHLSYGMITPPPTGTGSRRVQPSPVIDHKSIRLQAVMLTAENPLPVDDAPIMLTRGTSPVATPVK